MQQRLPSILTLRALRATANSGSFSAAAEQLGVTQGAVAQKVRQFEAEIGFKLFERWARGLRPTSTCKIYLAEIEPALERIGEATAVLSTNHQTSANQVTVSTTPSIASRWLIPKLSSFYVHHADIVITIDASEKLRRFTGPDAIDIALRWGGTPSEDLDAKPILSNLLIAVASPALVKSALPTVTNLANLTLINDGHHFWRKWSTTFAVDLPSIPLDFGQTNHAIDAAINGLGIALVPFMLVEEILKTGKLVRALPKEYDLQTDIQFYLMTKAQNQRAAVQTVCQWVLDQA
ncbi:LysR substrate-binding domain-containing protein [Maritalea porphyrae]|uniref:LysR substrate-binding domain-containing protein n=1 Tax=Maritalea porphyrae TaxID=880732 RepID=UPI0022AEA1A8|nr:LysR substrate-binding domain-containing protein [Maritalea porphyrae]MCZ4272329.1 LysR substrate-binding domain-containing protein [Maritalea porphyrae]